MADYIKLPRSTLTEDLWRDGNIARLYIYLLSKGDDPMSLRETSKDTGLTLQQVRTAIDKLKATGKITQIATQKTTQVATQISLCGIDSKSKSATQKTTQVATQIVTQVKSALEPYVDHRFAEAWQKWLDYRREINNKYKSPKSERIGYDQFIQKSNNDPVQAMAMVNNTIANGYKGLFPDRYDRKAKPTNDYASRAESRRRMSALASEIVSRDADIILGLYDGPERQSDYSIDKE